MFDVLGFEVERLESWGLTCCRRRVFKGLSKEYLQEVLLSSMLSLAYLMASRMIWRVCSAMSIAR